MSVTHSTYGKPAIAFTLVNREREPHRVHKVTADVMLSGPLKGVFDGDNSQLLPTGSFANAVFCLAAQQERFDAPSLVTALEAHFRETCPQLDVTIGLKARAIARPIQSNPHCFWDDAAASRSMGTKHSATDTPVQWCRISGVDFARTTGSQFAGFMRDRFTIMKDVMDRPHLPVFDFVGEFPQYQPGDERRLLEVAAEAYGSQPSLSAQYTMGLMGETMLARIPELTRVTLKLTAPDYSLIDLTPFGIDARKIYVPGLASSVVELTFEREQ